MNVGSESINRPASYMLLFLKTLLVAIAAIAIYLILYARSNTGLISVIALVAIPGLYFVLIEWRNLYLVLNDSTPDLKIDVQKSGSLKPFDKAFSNISKQQVASIDYKKSQVTVVMRSFIRL